MLAHWIAPPAVPLARLSTAATAMTRPTRSSTVTWMWTLLLPRTSAVRGQTPGASRWTKASSAYAASHAARLEQPDVAVAAVFADPRDGNAQEPSCRPWPDRCGGSVGAFRCAHGVDANCARSRARVGCLGSRGR